MYKVTFDDDTIFIGGKPRNSKWNSMLNKPIKKLEYKLGNQTLMMENFEAYNHIYETGGFVFQGGNVLLNVKVMGKIKGKVYVYIFDFMKRSVYTKIYKFGQEHNNRPTTGWKQGLLGLIPAIKLK